MLLFNMSISFVVLELKSVHNKNVHLVAYTSYIIYSLSYTKYHASYIILHTSYIFCRGSFELAAGIAGQLGSISLATHGIYMSTCGKTLMSSNDTILLCLISLFC